MCVCVCVCVCVDACVYVRRLPLHRLTAGGQVCVCFVNIMCEYTCVYVPRLSWKFNLISDFKTDFKKMGIILGAFSFATPSFGNPCG